MGIDAAARPETSTPEEAVPPADLPAPVRRFRMLALAGGPPTFETLRIETAAMMHRPRLPPVPLRITMAHRLGHEFAHDIRIGVGRLSIRFGVDAFVDGHGVMKVGSKVDSGPKFDRGALIAMWGEAISFPIAWDRLPGLAWQPIDHASARLLIPWAGGTIPIAMGFDPGTGYPTTFRTERHKGNGPLVGWEGLSIGWRSYPGGIVAPSRLQAKWDDEPKPWIDMRIERIDVDVPVEATLELGRRALREGTL
jgi:hypothetical protein